MDGLDALSRPKRAPCRLGRGWAMRQSVERTQIDRHLRESGRGGQACDDGEEKRAAHEQREPNAVPDGTEPTEAYRAMKAW